VLGPVPTELATGPVPADVLEPVPTVVAPLPGPTVVPVLVATVVVGPEPAAVAPPCPLGSSTVTVPEQAAWSATDANRDRTFHDCMIA
jgi:hypothetical protein